MSQKKNQKNERTIRKRTRKRINKLIEPEELEDAQIILVKDDYLDEIEKKMIKAALLKDKDRIIDYIV